MRDREGDGLPSPFADRYEIVRELGRGASAVVYLVRDQLHDREVALKVLSSDYASALGSARFLREIRLASRLQHPYIVPVLDSGEWEGWLYYVMPVIEGHPLRVRMTRERQLPVEDAVRYTMEIADALQHAHERGVLHRDVKPENILISGQHACLADFGIARAITPATDDKITTTGVILGTPAYMSPEQASSDGAIDGRSDQYALGCVLFEMLAGVPPFVGPTEQSVIMQRFQHAAPRVSRYRPTAGSALEAAVSRALHVTPADRFPSVSAFARELRPQAETVLVENQRDGGSPPGAGLSRRRVLQGSAVLLAGIVAITAWTKLTDGSDVETRKSLTRMMADVDSTTGRGGAVWYNRARGHFAAGRLDSAEVAFARAATVDPSLALASLWQAQLLQWRVDGRDGNDWSVPARRAMRGRDRLSVRDAHHALALVALAEQRYPDACREYSKVVAIDSQSFVGWFGLGECRRLDRVVVGDTMSPSGWRFRSELSDAIGAYTEALASTPGSQVAPILQRALQVFFSEPSLVRQGHAESARSRLFFAYPALVGDTVAFVPFPSHQMAALDSATAPRNRGSALQRIRELALAFVRRWDQQMPSNFEALAALSLALESRGDVTDEDPRTPDALSTIHDARRRSTSSRHSLLLQAAEVRLLVKSHRFAEAGRLADSALTSAEPLRDSSALVLASLATLQGNEERTVVHLRAVLTGDDGGRGELGVAVPTSLADRLSRLIAAVETGMCARTRLDSLEHDVESLITTLEEPSQRVSATAGLLDDVRIRAAVCTGGASASRILDEGNPYARLVKAAARQDSRSVRALLAQFDAYREGWSQSHLSWDTVALECWALVQTGAVAEAAARLDSTLVGLPFSSNWLTTKVRIAGGFRRVLKLRRDLAIAMGDTATARRWDSALKGLAGVAS